MKKMWRLGDRFSICAVRIVKARFNGISHISLHKCRNFKWIFSIQSTPGVNLPPLMVSLPVSTSSSQDPVTFSQLVRQAISNFLWHQTDSIGCHGPLSLWDLQLYSKYPILSVRKVSLMMLVPGYARPGGFGASVSIWRETPSQSPKTKFMCFICKLSPELFSIPVPLDKIPALIVHQRRVPHLLLLLPTV